MKYLKYAALAAFWLVMLAALGLALWLPVLIPASIKAFLGHAALSAVGVGALGLWLANGYAEAMRS